jgi:aminomethyltransferase
VLRYTSRSEEVSAIRRSVGISDRAHVTSLRIKGEDAYTLLDARLPCELYLRDGEVAHTLLLDQDAHPLADIFLANDDEEFLLLCEGMPAEALIAALQEASADAKEYEIEDLSATHCLLGLDGPFAWEFLAELEGHQIIGFPFATFYKSDTGGIFFRLGKTGEFGYDLLLPYAEADAFWERAAALGERFDLRPVGLEALEHCALENFFFNIRREGRLRLTPLELQLQWRLSYQKPFFGREALDAQRERGLQRRLTALQSDAPFSSERPLFCEGKPCGEILVAERSETLGNWLGLALIELPLAHSGLSFSTSDAPSAIPIRSISPPAVWNLSLLINPQKHSYRDPSSVAQLHEMLASSLRGRG